MKKNIVASVMLILSLSLVFTSCRTTKVEGSGIHGQEAKVAKVQRTLIDYQGATFGKEVPEWVMLVAEGQYDAKVLAPVMPGIEGKKVFVTIGRGDNLEFVKNWTDLVDVEVQVGDTIQRVVGKAVEAEMKGSRSSTGTTDDPSQIEQKVNMYKMAVTAVELNGLEKTASYWALIRVTDADGESYKDYYEYYAVWTMDEKLFKTQLDAAMKNVDSNTSEGETLRKAASSKVADTIIASNDASIAADTDKFLF